MSTKTSCVSGTSRKSEASSRSFGSWIVIAPPKSSRGTRDWLDMLFDRYFGLRLQEARRVADKQSSKQNQIMTVKQGLAVLQWYTNHANAQTVNAACSRKQMRAATTRDSRDVYFDASKVRPFQIEPICKRPTTTSQSALPLSFSSLIYVHHDWSWSVLGDRRIDCSILLAFRLSRSRVRRLRSFRSQ